MPTLHLICGLPCAGKTTLAKELETVHAALRLTPDEWHTRLFGQDAEDEAHDARHDLIESLMWEVAARALELGTSVILDFGFWSRRERETFCWRAAQLGAECKVHFLDVPKDDLFRRLRQRNLERPAGTFFISEAQLEVWTALFEPPSDDELAGYGAS